MKTVKLIWNNYNKEEFVKIDLIEEQPNGLIRLFLNDRVVGEYNPIEVTLIIIPD